MLTKNKYVIYTFATTTAAMAWEDACIELGLPGRIIPLPGSVAAGCGLCWRVPLEQAAAFGEDFILQGKVEKIVEIEM